MNTKLRRILEESTLLLIARLPGRKASALLRRYTGLSERELHNTLRRLRRARKIKYGWHVIEDE